MEGLLVVKIKHGEVLRRVTVPSQPGPTFAVLEGKIRDLFKIPSEKKMYVTYVDNEGDVVTMADEQDLKDAFILQGLNPLRLNVTVAASSTPAGAPGPTSGSSQAPPASHEGLQDVMKMIEERLNETFRSAGMKAEDVLQDFKPLLKVAPAKIAEILQAAKSSGLSASFEPIFEPGQCFRGFHAPPAQAPSQAPEAAAKPEVPASKVLAGGQPSAGLSRSSSSPEQPASEKLSKEAANSAGAAADTPQSSATPEAERVFHTGIQCDVCGCCPIVGPRYKSLTKSDYDLCRTCYVKTGSKDEEYNKIERPLYRPRHHPFWGPLSSKGFRGPGMRGPPQGGPFGGPNTFGGRPFNCRGPFGRCDNAGRSVPAEVKLDARFVQDVTIFDGTEMAPGSRFTKIWRLRNSGSAVWPHGSVLQLVGGDKLSDVESVTLQIPNAGLAPEEEVDVSVDLVAPTQPGRYVSHYRLVAPFGPKFGHRVWCLIQVVAKDDPSPQVAESVAAAATATVAGAKQQMTTPPAPELTPGDAVVAQEVVNEPVADPAPAPALGPELSVPVLLSVEVPTPVVTEEQEKQPASAEDAPVRKDLEVAPPAAVEGAMVAPAPVESPKVENGSLGGFSLVDAFTATSAAASSSSSSGSSQARAQAQIQIESEPVQVDSPQSEVSSEEGTGSFVMAPAPAAPAAAPAAPAPSQYEAEVESVLAQLEAMGFTDKDLNVDLLKEHGLNLQATIDDLVAAAEWDPMLEELEEMGFYDAKVNRRLMFKNKGSVKRVVKELVQMYKEEAESKKVEEKA
eukprot:jgi/Mesen1/858/ME000114S10942